ncbi:SDR family NAD(P)-dependent oxidoreductase [Adhaeribacter soli]|uniref:SDR family NAD(P)-dependent oxidoreductase n=1 Tax=Adhaeribacter soli TaxID=2607655 RepID=A0A5N1J9B3_9BACT|nr:SDR family NAD(P)-dependent oxidoreductase [Adhaeribacter soli]KAA9345578.1 SDR family NAD(P)-dependent oxidoreductase [Adhaeribacter soli]
MHKNIPLPASDNLKTAQPVGLVEWFHVGEYDRVKQVLSDLKKLGVTELRTGISWADFYSEKGKEWIYWLIPELAKEVKLLPCFLYTPPSLAMKPRTSAPPVTPKAFADFLDVIITDLGKHFEYVELWNEPNNKAAYDYTLDQNWNRFAEMVGGAAYWARQRGKKTVLGGMSPVDPNWLQLMFDRGVMQYIDAVGIHGFPDVFDQQWEGWEEQVKAVREILKTNHSQAEVWITEAGFSTWQHDEYRQLLEFRNALEAKVEKVYWYGVQDLSPEKPATGGFHVDEREYFFGLKKTDGSPKLLYRLWAEYGLGGLNKFPCLDRCTDKTLPEKYALITGGAGFVGTNVAKKLLSEGKQVVILDNLSRGGVERNLQWLHEQFPKQVHVCIADIRDKHTLRKVMKNATEVFHFAAQVAVTTSLDLPVNDFEINARGIINLLEAIREQDNPPSLVFTSTNKVYGGLEDLKFIPNGTRYTPAEKAIATYGISENRPLDFHSPYGCSKGSADQYVLDYARSYNLPAVVFRMSCIYGPHQYGTEDQGWVAHFAIRAIEDKPITIYGDGKQVRDILFVEDLVEAMMMAQKNMGKISGQAFNIGGGVTNTISLLELIEMLGEYRGKRLPLSFGEWRTGDQHYYVSDIRKFREATGWSPRHNVHQGVARLYKWLSEVRGYAVPEKLNVLEVQAETPEETDQILA